jgi:hypothetical protein
MKIDIKLAVGLIILALFASSWLGGLKPRQDRDRLNQEVISLQDTIEHRDVTIKGYRLSLARKDAVILTQREAIAAGLIEREELRKLNIKHLNSVTRLEARVDRLLDSIQHNGEIIYVTDTLYVGDTKPCIALPFDFNKKTEYLTLTGNFSSTGVMSAKVEVIAPLDIYIGLSRKTRDTEVKVTSPNPDLTVVRLNSVQIVKPTQRWWQRDWVQKIGIGLAGYGLGQMTK